MQIDRKQLIEEEKLRNYIRKAIKKINEGKESKILDDENKLRSVISKLMEADSNVAAPHRSTGINVLEDLLKKIIPQIEIEYKKLTTTPDQRASFRSHIVNAIQNSLAPVKVSDKAGNEEEAEQAIDIGLEEDMASALAKSDSEYKSTGMNVDEWRSAIAGLEKNIPLYVKFKTGVVNRIVKEGDDDFLVSEPEWKEVMKLDRKKIDDMAVGNPDYEILNLKEGTSYFNEEDDIEIEVGDEEPGPEAEEEFIDIDGEVEEPSEEEEKEQDFNIDGKDETGRNVAFRAFERIEQAVVDSYNILSDDDDRTLFYDYLITNIKLYFDKFEDEILTALPEPTTPEYEQEKDSQLDSGEEDLGL
jgi:hypothetical protein